MSHQSHDADPSSFQDPCIYLPHRHVHEWIKEPLWHPTTLKQMHFHWEIFTLFPSYTHIISFSPLLYLLPLPYSLSLLSSSFDLLFSLHYSATPQNFLILSTLLSHLISFTLSFSCSTSSTLLLYLHSCQADTFSFYHSHTFFIHLHLTFHKPQTL